MIIPGSSQNAPLRSNTHAQGLVIDDCFSISVEKQGRSHVTQPQPKTSGRPLSPMRSTASWAVRSCDAGTLSHVTLLVCSLGYTADSLHVCLMGAWVSLLLFRRPMMAILGASFRLVDFNSIDAQNPTILRLPRRARDEMVLLATMMPLMVTELSAPYRDKVFATGASSTKGAVIQCSQGTKVAEVLWKSCRSKGSYTRFRTQQQQLLRQLGQDDEPQQVQQESIKRPLAS